MASWEAGAEQRVRYETGRMSAAQEFAGPLLRKHDAASLEAAWFLLTPPYAVAVFSVVVAGLLSLAAGAHCARLDGTRLLRRARARCS